MLVDDLSGTGKHIITIAIDQNSRGAGSGQSAQLLGTDRDPMKSGQELQAISMGFALAVVPGA